MSTRTVLVDKKDTASVARCSFWAIASETLLLGDVVAYDVAQTAVTNGDYKYVLKADSDVAGAYLPAGVAVTAAAAGAVVEVVYWGQVDTLCDGTVDIAQNDILVISSAAGVAVGQTLDPTSAALLKASLKFSEIGRAAAAYTTNSAGLVNVFVRLPRPA